MGLKDFLRGAASVLDLGGALGPVSPYEGMTPEQADRAALWSDWAAVGDAMRVAMAGLGIRPDDAAECARGLQRQSEIPTLVLATALSDDVPIMRVGRSPAGRVDVAFIPTLTLAFDVGLALDRVDAVADAVERLASTGEYRAVLRQQDGDLSLRHYFTDRAAAVRRQWHALAAAHAAGVRFTRTAARPA